MSQAQQNTEDDLIDKEEFKRLMTDTFQPLNIPVTQDMVDWNFSKIDTDNSGRITFKEYMEFVNKYNSASSSTQVKTQTTKQVVSKQSSGENNEDDLIDKTQFKRLMVDTFKPLNIQVTEDMVDWNFAQIDTDNSGRITFKQYTDFVNKYNSSGKSQAQKPAAKPVVQQVVQPVAVKTQNNQDDLIDKAEFKRLMTDTFKPLNIPVTQDMVDWNFAQIDTDNSGRITFKEYTDFVSKYN